eukprot:scaffold91001_cov45-Phaeocystis_antarctica.AAC.1
MAGRVVMAAGTVVAVRGVDVDVEGEGARRRLRVDVREDDAQPLVCRSVRVRSVRVRSVRVREACRGRRPQSAQLLGGG